MLQPKENWNSSIPARANTLGGQLKTSYSNPSSQHHPSETFNSAVNFSEDFLGSDYSNSAFSSLMIAAFAFTLVMNAGFVLAKQPETTSSVYNFKEHKKQPKEKCSHSWFNDFCNHAASVEKPAEIFPLVQGIATLFKKKDYGSVEEILAIADLDNFSNTAMVALVRTTYPAKDKLNNWTDTVERVRENLVRKGLDAEKLLRGLS